MLYFHNDYNELCHPKILEKMQAIQSMQMDGYGEDTICRSAAELIRVHCDASSAHVHFLSGGTQTNLTVIAAALRPHQAVIAAESGHIHVHETGSIEATGHKVIALSSKDGKITADQILSTVTAHWNDTSHEHIAQPKLVYISHPTEFGTTYTHDELEAIHQVCQHNGLMLFVDGARLGYALAAKDNDISLADLAKLTDVFYIGGTKVGAMFGEAVVISNPNIAEDFRYIIKQRGGMLAKGWILGVQFKALFEDNLYLQISAHANTLADRIRAALEEAGYPLAVPGSTNQVFAIFPNDVLEDIGKEFTYSYWGKADEKHSIVRFCTSWASNPAYVDALCCKIKHSVK